MNLMNWLKRRIAGKELDELALWREGAVNMIYYMGSFPEVVHAVAHLRAIAHGEETNFGSIIKLMETLRIAREAGKQPDDGFPPLKPAHAIQALEHPVHVDRRFLVGSPPDGVTSYGNHPVYSCNPADRRRHNRHG